MINVTKTFFPPIADYQKQVQRIWDNQWLTNRGALVLELEEKLKKHLSVSNIIIMNNETIPIQIALPLILLCTIITALVFLVDFFYLTEVYDIFRLIVGSMFSLVAMFLTSYFFKLEPYIELRGLLKR
jgi:hypothetical protein